MPNGKIARWNNNGYTYIGDSNNNLSQFANYSDVSNIQNQLNSTVRTQRLTLTQSDNVGVWSESNNAYSKFTHIPITSASSCVGLCISINISVPSITVNLANTSYSYASIYFALYSGSNRSISSVPYKAYNAYYQHQYTNGVAQSINTTITAHFIPSNMNSLYAISDQTVSKSFFDYTDLYFGLEMACYYQSSTNITIPSYNMVCNSYFTYIP